MLRPIYPEFKPECVELVVLCYTKQIDPCLQALADTLKTPQNHLVNCKFVAKFA